MDTNTLSNIYIDFDTTIANYDEDNVLSVRDGAKKYINILREKGHKIVVLSFCDSLRRTKEINNILNRYGINYDEIEKTLPKFNYHEDKKKFIFISENNFGGFSGWKSAYMTISRTHWNDNAILNLIKDIVIKKSETCGEYFDNYKCRKREVVEAHQIMMWLCCRYTRLSLSTIGGNIRGKDHATVLHAKKTINDLIETSKKMRDSIEYYEDVLKNNGIFPIMKKNDNINE